MTVNLAIRTFLSVAALCTIVAHADELSYTAVSASAAVEDWDGFDEDSKGLRLDGSVEIGDVFYVWGSVSRAFLDLDGPGFSSEIETRVRSVGVGIHRGFADKLSFHGEVGAMRHTAEYKLLPFRFHLDEPSWVDEENAITETDRVNGWIASGGLRAMLNDRIELFGSLTHREAENDGVSTFSAGVEFDMVRGFGLRASVSAQEDAGGYRIGVVWRN